MGILFSTADYDVGITFWRKHTFVRDRRTGQKYLARKNAVDALFHITVVVNRKPLTQDQRSQVLAYATERFIATVINPESLPGQMFVSRSPEAFVAEVISASQRWDPTPF